MRVCHIISGDLWAGAESMAARLFEGLHRHPEVAPIAILLNEGSLARAIRALDIPLTIFDERTTSLPTLAARIRTLIRREKPDVIHAHRYKENLLAWAASAGRGGPRLVATQHGMPEVHRGATHLRQRLVARGNFFLMARRFDFAIAVSAEIRDVFVSLLGFRPDKVRVIRNGVPISPLPGSRSRPGRIMVGSSGRFFPVKDYPFMVEVARSVLDDCNEVGFELAGDGPEREVVKAGIRRHGLGGSFILRGNVDDMDSFYHGLDVYLSTSVHEGIPMSVLEAMGHGTPVVAPRVGGFPEIIRDGIEGFLVEERCPRRFAQAVLRLARDPVLRAGMGAAARMRVARDFTVEHMAQGYLEAYRDVLR